MEQQGFRQISEQIGNKYSKFEKYGNDFNILGITIEVYTEEQKDHLPIDLFAEIVGYREIAPMSGEGVIIGITSREGEFGFFNLGTPSANSLEDQMRIVQTSFNDYTPLVENKVIKSLKGLTAVEMRIIVDQIQCIMDRITEGKYIHPRIVREQLQNSPELSALLKVEEQ